MAVTAAMLDEMIDGMNVQEGDNAILYLPRPMADDLLNESMVMARGFRGKPSEFGLRLESYRGCRIELLTNEADSAYLVKMGKPLEGSV